MKRKKPRAPQFKLTRENWIDSAAAQLDPELEPDWPASNVVMCCLATRSHCDATTRCIRMVAMIQATWTMPTNGLCPNTLGNIRISPSRHGLLHIKWKALQIWSFILASVIIYYLAVILVQVSCLYLIPSKSYGSNMNCYFYGSTV